MLPFPGYYRHSGNCNKLYDEPTTGARNVFLFYIAGGTGKANYANGLRSCKAYQENGNHPYTSSKQNDSFQRAMLVKKQHMAFLESRSNDLLDPKFPMFVYSELKVVWIKSDNLCNISASHVKRPDDFLITYKPHVEKDIVTKWPKIPLQSFTSGGRAGLTLKKGESWRWRYIMFHVCNARISPTRIVQPSR